MGTGLELALAILPLLISATEHHQKGLSYVKTLASNDSKNEKQLRFYVELHDELALLAATLASVLAGLPSRSGTPGLSALNKGELNELQNFLGDNAPAFEEILQRLLKSLNDLVSEKSLQLTNADVSIHTSRTMFARLESFRCSVDAGNAATPLRERLRFTRHEKSRSVAMGRIKDASQKLHLLFQTSILSNINSYQRSPLTPRPRPERLRRISEPLYRKMARKLSDACGSHNQHEARLPLWNCCSRERHERPSDSLDMIVSVTDVEEDGAHWQESIILIPSNNNQLPKEPTVRFNLGHENSHNVMNGAFPGQDVDSESMCNLIQQAHRYNAALQVIFDSGKLWKTKARRNSMQILKQKDITLKDFLYQTNSRIILREKLILAVVMSHAALHGSDGPWLSDNWSKEHICFFRNGSSDQPDLVRPFLKVSFQEDNLVRSDARAMLTNSSWEALGILLLEIHLAKAIESEYTDEDLLDGKPNAMTNLTTALRLLDATEGELYEGYRAAIKECLKPDMCCPETEDFRKKVYQKVVQPLEEELFHGFHLSPEDLKLGPGTFV